MKRAFGILMFVWFALIFAGIFLLFYPLFLLFLSTPKLYPLANFLRKIWAWVAVLLSFSIPLIENSAGKLPDKCIFVSNHTSYLDIVVLGLFAPSKICFIGKSELEKIPLFGIFFRTVDISVKRESIKDSHKAFTEAIERLNLGYSINIYPEGTIWNRTPELKEFKNGAFKLAIETGVPIVPITFYNNYKTLPDEKFEYYPSLIRCHIHRPITTAHLNENDAIPLKNEIYNLIRGDLVKQKILNENK